MLSNYDPSDVDNSKSPNDSMDGDNYMWVGASAVEIIISSVAASKLVNVNNVLDLPCGHGRVLRHLVKLFPDAAFDACDLDEDGLEFCAKQFGARPVRSHEDLGRVSFDKKYDLIWIGSLFTHTSADITKRWLSILASSLTDEGIIVATFHGRIAPMMQKIHPYIAESRWKVIQDGYNTIGYGYNDYDIGRGHAFIKGSYGVSAAKPHAIITLLQEIPNTRIYSYQERGWGNNHDVAVIGRPAWDLGFR
jgi:SAM-dependent methyltransferase